MAAGHRACHRLCRWIFSVHDSVLPHGLGAHEPLKHQPNDRLHAACLIHVTKVTDLTREGLLAYRRVLHRSSWFLKLCFSSKFNGQRRSTSDLLCTTFVCSLRIIHFKYAAESSECVFRVQEICLPARVNWALPWPVCKKVRGTARSWMEDPPACNWRLIVRSERASGRLFGHVQATA